MKIRFITAALAAFFMLPFFGTAALAVEIEPQEPDIPATTVIAEQETTGAAEVIDAEPAPVTGGIDLDAPAGPMPKPFTPSGTGTVVDNATDADGKEFFTIMTPDENVFYLIIDRQRGNENVYFLNAVTEADLLSLAKLPEKPATSTPAAEQTPAPVSPEPTPEQTAPERDGGNMGMIILLVAVVLVGGGAGWYFKIYRPKQQAASEEDYGETEPDGYDDDGQETEEDDSPPWYDDDESDGPDGDDGE